MTATLLLIASALAGPAAEPTAAEPATSWRSYRDQPEQFAVALLDAGAEPRAPLRLSPVEGTVSQLSLAASGHTDARVGEGPTMPVTLPTTQQHVTITVYPGPAAGEVRLGVLADHYDADGALGTATPKQLASVGPLGLELVLDDQARVLEVTTRAAPADLAHADDLWTRLGALLPQLPAEPVGVGARWSTLRDLTRGGVALHGVLTWTLVDVADDQITLERTFELSNWEQSGTLGGQPPGVSVALESVSLREAGRVVLNARAVAPAQALSQSELAIGVRTTSAQGSLQARSVAHSQLAIAPASAPPAKAAAPAGAAGAH